MRHRYDNLRRIQALDPDVAFEDIYRQMVLVEFPFDMKVGLNLGFNRSFSTPAVAAVLAGTGELTERTQKRRDDTGLLMYELILNGLDHPRSRAAIRRINEIHRPYRDMPAEEYRYVLACCVVIPLRWLDRYAWRRPCCHERRSTFRFYAELGRRMRVTGIPDDLAELESWFDAYDAEHLVPNEAAAAIERATRALLVKPGGLGEKMLSALYDDRLRAATGVPVPSWPIRAGVHLGLRGRALALRHVGRPRRVPRFADGLKAKSYPDGYEISELGPGAARRPD
ncbi:hypothetical protein GCM10010168_24100 [Actinoplanes ianthinogenes]|uniref:ER-bound oxygenase mpaB/mpaB'/Rubber oxygenase catalytic domain-containing protein n=1 Tax=Actinoplanes ianthinogenes TaxID=122358 RepID=A0ABM7M8U9_9ACTN|nr:oxygenase MpaB family protein [Actinoplanes ianthinogenes]BCJ48050.1 hypothetical protein Aiant_87070 [Actinoplanes ianthinogenes]GGR06047.1 hypothetical protein GCM10010168_24100 [Actinoplanes ianthinogenes]